MNNDQRLAECVNRFKRAQRVNRKARKSTGKAKADAYHTKTKILLGLEKRFCDLIQIYPDPRKPSLLVFFLPEAGGLHIRARDYKPTARAV